jgi:hypothetical protein
LEKLVFISFARNMAKLVKNAASRNFLGGKVGFPKISGLCICKVVGGLNGLEVKHG